MSAEPNKPGPPFETLAEGPETLGPDATGVFATVEPLAQASAPAPTLDGTTTPGGHDPGTVGLVEARGIIQAEPTRRAQAIVPGGTPAVAVPTAAVPIAAPVEAGTIDLLPGPADPPLPSAATGAGSEATGIFTVTTPPGPASGPAPSTPTVGDSTGEYLAVPTRRSGAAPTPDGADQATVQATGVFVAGSRDAAAPGQAGGEATAMIEAAGGYDRTIPDAQAATPRPSGSPPRSDPDAPRCGRYVLKGFHARGGMGEIWMAEDPAIGRSVALKRMLGQRPDQIHRFFVEAQVTGQLEHPGIVPVHELGINEQGQPFYTMKFVQGRTLQTIVEEFHAGTLDDGARELEQLRLLQIFVSLCQTVGYAHSRGVLHRDLKPENVMLGPYGETIVLDWGIAKVIGQPGTAAGESPGQAVNLLDSGDEETQTRAGAIMGTPAYMAPEVAMGRNEDVDQRSDVYLLGATLYEMMTGRQPRRAKTAMEMIRLAQKEPPPPASKVNPRVPKALDAICRKAMAQSKAERYPSALELAEDVQRFVAGEPVSAYPEGLAVRAWRWARRHRKALARAVAAIVFVSVVGFSAVAVRRAERDRLSARREADALKRQEQERLDVREFRRLADEARYYATTSDPVSEHAPYFDPQQGESTALAALAIAAKWGPSLAQLSLPNEREALRRDLYDLLLLTAQLQGRRRGEPAANQVARVFLLATQAGGPTGSEVQPARVALALLDEAGRLHEPSRGLYRLRAQAHAQLGDQARAAEDERRAQDPGRPATYLDHFLLGETFRNEASGRDDPNEERKLWQPDPERMEKAIGEYRQALLLAPEHYWSHYQLGRCYLSLGRLDEAVETLGTCIALRPDAPWGYSARSLALVRKNRFREAEHDLERALRLNPDCRTARLNRGVVYMLQGKHDPALAEFDAVLQPPRDKQVIEAAYYRGLLRLQLGEPRQALVDFDSVVKEIPGFRAVYLDRARASIALGRSEAALEDLDRFRDLLEGRRLERQGWLLHARRGRLLRMMYTELPIDQRAKSPAAQALLSLGLAELLTAVKRQGRAPQLFDDTGAMLELTGRLAEAIQAYSVGLDLDPRNVRLRVKRGWALLQANRQEQALADFAAAAGVDPENAEVHSGLGYVRALRKLRSGAQHEAELALIQGVDSYLVLHNVACIYAALSESADDQAAANQKVAIALIRRAIALWKKTDKGPNEIDLIKAEPAFGPLRNRKDFQELIRGPS